MLQLALVDTLVPSNTAVVRACRPSTRRHLLLQVLPAESEIISVRVHCLTRTSIVHEGAARLSFAVDVSLRAVLAHGSLLRAI